MQKGQMELIHMDFKKRNRMIHLGLVLTNLEKETCFFFFLLNTNVNFNYVFFRCQVQQLSGHFNILAFSLKKPNSDWQEEERIGLKEAEV